jgi:hypothetical protein
MTMYSESTLVTARSAFNASGPRRTVQAWPGINGGAQPGARRVGARSTSTAIVLDFVRARDARAVAQIQALADKDVSLPLADLAIIAALFLATIFYPAMAWFVLS